MIKKLFAIITFIFVFIINAFPQNGEPEMADVFRAEGKIYTVVAVVLLVLIGLLVYLFVTERKLHNLEKRINK